MARQLRNGIVLNGVPLSAGYLRVDVSINRTGGTTNTKLNGRMQPRTFTSLARIVAVVYFDAASRTARLPMAGSQIVVDVIDSAAVPNDKMPALSLPAITDFTTYFGATAAAGLSTTDALLSQAYAYLLAQPATSPVGQLLAGSTEV